MDAVKDAEDLHVDFYLSEKIRKRICHVSESQLFLTDTTSVAQQIRKGKYDLAIIGTAHRYFDTFSKISKENHTAVIVHNMNFSRAGKGQLLSSVLKEDQAFRLKLLIKEGLLKAPEVYRNSAKLVLDESLAIPGYQYLPLFYCEAKEVVPHSVLTVVVPGSVSQSRRDYRHILEQIETFKQPVKLVFLGKASGNELKMINDFLEKKPPHIELIYFEEKLSSEEFSQWMQAADLLWCPIQKETAFFNIPEVYGKTKMTGNIGDAIKSGKIAVFPADYQSDYPFIFQEEKNLEQQFRGLAQNAYQKKDFPAKETVKQQLISLLKKL